MTSKLGPLYDTVARCFLVGLTELMNGDDQYWRIFDRLHPHNNLAEGLQFQYRVPHNHYIIHKTFMLYETHIVMNHGDYRIEFADPDCIIKAARWLNIGGRNADRYN